jgi:predicted transcriptional regulator
LYDTYSWDNLRKGLYPSEIAKKTGLSKQAINYYLGTLLNVDFVIRGKRGFHANYLLTQKAEHYLTRFLKSKEEV